VAAISTVVALPDNRILASSDPRAHPVGERLGRDFLLSFADDAVLLIDEENARARSRRVLHEADNVAGALYAEFDITQQMEVRRAIFWALAGINALVAILTAAVGYGLARRMLAPMRVLGRHLARARDGDIAPIAAAEMKPSGTEFGRLFRGFNAMAAAVFEREQLRARLAEEEKLALLGRLASGMAHEVNNPLGGLLNTVDTLRRHGDDVVARAASLNLLERGLIGIRNVVHTALVTYRDRGDAQKLSAADLDDLRHLVAHEIRRRNLSLTWTNTAEGEIPLNGPQIRQAFLNLLLNACAASAPGNKIAVEVRRTNEGLVLSVSDQGAGLPDEIRSIYEDQDGAGDMLRPGSGLGAWTVRRLMNALGGTIAIETPAGGGTRVVLSIPLDGMRRVHAVA